MRRGRRQRALGSQQRVCDFVRIDRLGQDVVGAELRRAHRHGEAGIARSDDDTGRWPRLSDGPHHVQATAVAKAHVDEGELGAERGDGFKGRRDAPSGKDPETTFGQRACQPVGKKLVVFHEQQVPRFDGGLGLRLASGHDRHCLLSRQVSASRGSTPGSRPWITGPGGRTVLL